MYIRPQCVRCKSYAINPEDHGRKPNVMLEYCDVCYWREIAENYQNAVNRALTPLNAAQEQMK